MFYTEIRAKPDDLRIILELLGESINFTNVLTDKNRWGTINDPFNVIIEQFFFGFTTEGMPRKVLLNKLAKLTKVNFTAKSISNYEMEPEQILEYKLGALVDEQYHRKPRKVRL